MAGVQDATEVKSTTEKEKSGDINAISSQKSLKRSREESPNISRSDRSSSSSSESPERKERKKKKKKSKHKKRKRDYYDSSSEDDADTTKTKLFSITEKENEWNMDSRLAKYIKSNSRKYVPDKTLETTILDKNPVPANIEETLKLDQTFNTFLRKKGNYGSRAIQQDKSVARISSKVRDILGPLAKIWQNVERARAQKDTGSTPFLDLEDLALNFQHAMLLLGQAINATNFFRRKTVLTTLGVKEAEVGSMLRELYVEELAESKDMLFGENFMKSINKQAKTLNKTVSQILVPTYHHEKDRDVGRQPNQKGSSSNRHRGEERRSNNSGVEHQNQRQRGKILLQRTSISGKEDQGVPRELQGKSSASSTKSKLFLLQSQEGELSPEKYSEQNSPRSHQHSRKTPCETPTTSRGNETVFKKLGEINPGSLHSEYCKGGIDDPTTKPTKTGENPQRNILLLRNEKPGEERNPDIDGERGCEKSTPRSKPILIQLISKGEKRKRDLSPCDKFKKPKCLHPIRKIQNGNSEGCERHPETGRLPGENRSKRCILLHSPSPKIKKLGEVSMGREHIRISMPDVWTGTGTKNIHKTSENTDFVIEKATNKDCDLHRRHSNYSLVSGRSKNGERICNLSPRESGVCDKLQKVGAGTNPNIRVPRNHNKQSNNDIFDPKREIREDRNSMRGPFEIQTGNLEEAIQCNRKSNGNSSSIHTSPSTSEVSAEVSETEPRKNCPELRGLGNSRPPSKGGIDMVEGESETLEWETHKDPTPRSNNQLRCSQGPPRGLGSTLWEGFDRWSVDTRGEGIAHQYLGIESSLSSHKNLYKKQQKHCNPLAPRQPSCTSLCAQNGKTIKRNPPTSSQRDLDLSDRQTDHSYCRIHPIQTEQNSRLQIEELSRLGRLEIRQNNFQKSNSTVGNARDRSICVQDVSPDSKVLQLESGPTLFGSRCPSTKMGPEPSLCISPFLSDRKVSGKVEKDQYHTNPNCTHMGNSAMVSNTLGNADSTPKDNPTNQRELKTPIRGTPSISNEQNTESSSLENIRLSGKSETLSKTAETLVSKSRAEGTRKHYNSAWGRFVCWCSERKIDPFSCSLEEVMNYLGNMFEEGREYSTINLHRSAISAFHQLIDLKPVGQHPKLISLMKGIGKERPLQPKYVDIWDIDTVLDFYRNGLENQSLSLKDLSIKLVTLLGLVSPNRGSELCELDTDLMGKSETTYLFHLVKPMKTSKQGKKNKPIEFRKFTQEEKICPYNTLEEYLRRTENFRKQSETSKLFLSHVKPHKPVGKDTIARWVKEALERAGIDVKVFKPHSKRAASTSKAFVKGANLQDIMKMGNWSNSSTWQTFYHKDFSPTERYQTLLLEGQAVNKDLACVPQS